MKRSIDIVISSLGLICFSPILIVFLYLIYRQDKHSPFYKAPRVTLGGKEFTMYKLRSMIINADNTGVNSTSSDDRRITPVGNLVRKYKLDEIMQLWNVLIGDMSLVGPRPNVKSETDLYTSEEQKLLSIKPGITDFSSIVFSDEGEILKGSLNPDLSYHQLIRPWKSRLGLIYIQNQSTILDFKLIFYTALAIISKQHALKWVAKQLAVFQVDKEIIEISLRNKPLMPHPPLGSDKIIEYLPE